MGKKSNCKKPEQHHALAEFITEDICPSYEEKWLSAYEAVCKEEFKKPLEEINFFEKMVATLTDELHIVKPYREYFVGHSVQCMDQIMCAVAEAETTSQGLVKDK
eukprot:12993961-Ditylum_brightwellii.AAC.1